MSLHNGLTSTDIHVIHALTYADATSRTGATGLLSTDIGKIAKQTDTSRFYILTNHSPVTWSEVTAPSNGGGGINYITNTNSEDSAAGWAAYADAAATSPVDGTGGSPTVTITRSTSSPLRGTANFLLTKDAANRQGQGVSYDFTIDRADLAKSLEVSFDFEPTTGFVASTGAVGNDSDIEVYLYDVTNAALIPISPKVITSGVAIQQTFKGSFQSNATSTSYRLILHVATTSATAYTLKFDNVRVGPATIVQGSPTTDAISFTPTGSWTTNTTYTGTYKRIGDMARINIHLALAGAPNNTGLTVNLPSGLVLDTAKLTLNSSGSQSTVLGFGSSKLNAANASNMIELAILYNGGTSSVTPYIMGANNTGNYVTDQNSIGQAGPAAWASGDWLDFTIEIPIVGWSSNVQMSSDADTRVVAARYKNGATQTISNNTDTKVNSSTTIEFDTHGVLSAGTYTVPVSGFYKVSASLMFLNFNSASEGIIKLFKNGSVYSFMFDTIGPASGNFGLTGSDIVSCKAGDTLEVYVRQSSGGNKDLYSDPLYNHVTFERMSGPASIAATEKVYAFLQANGGTSLTGGTTNIDWTSKTFDSHGAWGSNTTFTAPKSAWYEFKGVVNTASINTEIYAWVNGVNQFQCGPNDGGAATATHKFAGAYFLKAGDTLTFRVGNNTTLSNSASQHWLSIASQG